MIEHLEGWLAIVLSIVSLFGVLVQAWVMRRRDAETAQTARNGNQQSQDSQNDAISLSLLGQMQITLTSLRERLTVVENERRDLLDRLDKLEEERRTARRSYEDEIRVRDDRIGTLEERVRGLQEQVADLKSARDSERTAKEKAQKESAAKDVAP